MRKYSIVVLSIVLLHNVIWSQCQIPMTNTEFQNIRQRINILPGGSSFYNNALNVCKNNCFTTEQSRDLANYFTTDRDKLEFLKTIYPGVIDKNNFIDVMDVFKYFSTAFRLYDWIQEHSITYQNTSNSNTVPVLNYPSTQFYNGRINCQNPITQNQLAVFKANYSRVRDNRLLAGQVLNFAKNSCLTAANAMELTQFISDESIRLDVFIKLLPNIYDIDHYGFASQLLTSQNYANIFASTLSQYQASINNLPYQESTSIPNRNNHQNNSSNGPFNCKLSIDEQNTFIASLNNISFDNDKISQIKISMAGRCLFPSQIKALMSLPSFESSKLEIAKMMYDRCLDKKNYYLINDAFAFESSIRELNKYIANR